LYFKIAETQESAEEIETYQRYKYPTMSKTQGNFKLTVVEGEFTDSQIVVMLGENGTGKTTFIRMLVMPSLLASLSDMFRILSSGKKILCCLVCNTRKFFQTSILFRRTFLLFGRHISLALYCLVALQ
jgi:ABC-type siderophore export system fused ATPase/permease subunit